MQNATYEIGELRGYRVTFHVQDIVDDYGAKVTTCAFTMHFDTGSVHIPVHPPVKTKEYDPKISDIFDLTVEVTEEDAKDLWQETKDGFAFFTIIEHAPQRKESVKRGRKPGAKKSPGTKKFPGHKCCGSKGPRHKKDCKGAQPIKGGIQREGLKPTKVEEEDEDATAKKKTEKVKEMLKDGENPNDIHAETGISIQSINFIKRQMIGRGEISDA